MITETTFAVTRTFPSRDGSAVIELVTDRTGNLHIVRGRRADDTEPLVRKVFASLDEAREFANALWAAPAPVAAEQVRPNALNRAPVDDAVRGARRVQVEAAAVTNRGDLPIHQTIRSNQRAAVVPAGHYAVEYLGVLRFYAVVAGKGRWEGRTFVNRYHSDDLLDVHRTEAFAVRALIAADPEAAGQRFAAELTRCRRCARMLTDLATAAKNGGWGPECVKKVGA